jgi:hypothetical protein
MEFVAVDMKPVRNYCTYFDSGYLTRGLALIESMRAHARPFRLWILCMDADAERALARLNMPEIELITIAQLEARNPDLAAARATRSRMEFYFTCTPCLPVDILERSPAVDEITYLDADLYFFADPQPVFDELADADVGIIGHRFGPALRHMEKYGRFNVGFLTFRRTPAGMECLRWWRTRCVEWCYDRLDGERFADQKYLDQWQQLFPGVRELLHPGANVGPWNVANLAIQNDAGRLLVDRQPLICFHFHGLKRCAPGIFDPQLKRYELLPSAPIRKLVYQPYLRALDRAAKAAGGLNMRQRVAPRSIREHRAPAATDVTTMVAEGLRSLKMLAGRAVRRELIYYVNGQVV